MQYNPKVISVEEVRHGGFLQAGNQEIAIVQEVDKEHGQAIISATRQPNTAGASGTGTIMGIVIKALASGTSALSIVQVNAKDSQQRPIQISDRRSQCASKTVNLRAVRSIPNAIPSTCQKTGTVP
jgi:hypothetical protein